MTSVSFNMNDGAEFADFFVPFSFVIMAGDWDLEAGNAMLCSYGLVPLMVNLYVRPFTPRISSPGCTFIVQPRTQYQHHFPIQSSAPKRKHSTNKSPTSCIHAYLALRSPSTLFQPRPCPNCNHIPPSALPRWQRQRHVALPADSSPTIYHPPAQGQGQLQTQGHVHAGGPGHSRSSKEIYAPFMHSYGDGEGEGDARESSEFQTSGFNTPRQSAETLRSEGREEEGLGGGSGSGNGKNVGSLV
jgi:hypothetical protein